MLAAGNIGAIDCSMLPRTVVQFVQTLETVAGNAILPPAARTQAAKLIESSMRLRSWELSAALDRLPAHLKDWVVRSASAPQTLGSNAASLHAQLLRVTRGLTGASEAFADSHWVTLKPLLEQTPPWLEKATRFFGSVRQVGTQFLRFSTALANGVRSLFSGLRVFVPAARIVSLSPMGLALGGIAVTGALIFVGCKLAFVSKD